MSSWDCSNKLEDVAFSALVEAPLLGDVDRTVVLITVMRFDNSSGVSNYQKILQAIERIKKVTFKGKACLGKYDYLLSVRALDEKNDTILTSVC